MLPNKLAKFVACLSLVLPAMLAMSSEDEVKCKRNDLESYIPDISRVTQAASCIHLVLHSPKTGGTTIGYTLKKAQEGFAGTIYFDNLGGKNVVPGDIVVAHNAGDALENITCQATVFFVRREWEERLLSLSEMPNAGMENFKEVCARFMAHEHVMRASLEKIKSHAKHYGIVFKSYAYAQNVSEKVLADIGNSAGIEVGPVTKGRTTKRPMLYNSTEYRECRRRIRAHQHLFWKLCDMENNNTQHRSNLGLSLVGISVLACLVGMRNARIGHGHHSVNFQTRSTT